MSATHPARGPTAISIGTLSIRAPGRTRSDARALAQGVIAALEGRPLAPSMQSGAVSVRVEAAPGMDDRTLGDMIATRAAQALETPAPGDRRRGGTDHV
jgi:hypothetical protein